VVGAGGNILLNIYASQKKRRGSPTERERLIAGVLTNYPTKHSGIYITSTHDGSSRQYMEIHLGSVPYLFLSLSLVFPEA